MTINVIEEVKRLNSERESLVNAICQDALKEDRTYAGAKEYLQRVREDCIEYEDNVNELGNVIDAYGIYRDADSLLEHKFKEHIEKRKHEKIW